MAKTNPKHKATFTLVIHCKCSCGWEGGGWCNKDAKANAAAEWRSHREKCEAVEEESQNK